MQVTETLSQGLKREFEVKLPMEELEERLSSELSNIKDKVRLNGFRPGKVPVAHLRRVYGRSVMADVVQNAVTEANRKIVEDHGLKLAMEPKIEFPEDKDEVTKALEAKGDLAFKIAVEVLPSFELADLSGVEVTKKVAAVSDEDLNATLERMAAANRSFTAKPESAAAENGDRVTIDFVGRVDGVEFEGGKGEGVPIVLGSGQFIPGFEDQLVGAKAGDQRLVKVTFPTAYNEPKLAGKDAEFDVTVKEVAGPDEIKIDDEMAKAFGLDSLDALKDAVRGQMGRDLDLQSRRLVKKELLDALDQRYTFELPPTLVDQEFEGIWRQVESDMKSSGKSFADEGTTEEAAKADYRKIAERRVRLGLVLAQVGETAEIKVSDEEVTQGLVERTRQFPGQERQVWEFYQKNPQALAEIRAPLFEEKVVDHILGQVKVNEQSVDKEALFAEEGDEAKSGDTKSGETKSGEA